MFATDSSGNHFTLLFSLSNKFDKSGVLIVFGSPSDIAMLNWQEHVIIPDGNDGQTYKNKIQIVINQNNPLTIQILEKQPTEKCCL